MKIEEAIVYLLSTDGHGMTPEAIVREITSRQLYVRKDGYEVSTWELVNKVFGPGKCEYYVPYIGDVTFFSLFAIVEQDYWKIDEELVKLVKQRKEFKLDYSKYEDQAVGLPYNNPFVVRKMQ